MVAKIVLGLVLWIVTLRLRIQWARILVSGRRVRLRGPLAVCGGQGALLQVLQIHTAPQPE
jgi:hypothetical protein